MFPIPKPTFTGCLRFVFFGGEGPNSSESPKYVFVGHLEFSYSGFAPLQTKYDMIAGYNYIKHAVQSYTNHLK